MLIPALFATGKDDKFILPHHAQDLHEKYAGDTSFLMFAGDHHSARNNDFFETASQFLHDRLTQAAVSLEASYQARQSTRVREEQQRLQQQLRAQPTIQQASQGASVTPRANNVEPRFLICASCGQLCESPGSPAFRCPSCGVLLEDSHFSLNTEKRVKSGPCKPCVVS